MLHYFNLSTNITLTLVVIKMSEYGNIVILSKQHIPFHVLLQYAVVHSSNVLSNLIRSIIVNLPMQAPLSSILIVSKIMLKA